MPLTDDDLPLKTEAAAEYLGVEPMTLRRWVQQKRGPKFLKIGVSVRYLAKDLRAYRDACLVQTTVK